MQFDLVDVTSFGLLFIKLTGIMIFLLDEQKSKRSYINQIKLHQQN